MHARDLLALAFAHGHWRFCTLAAAALLLIGCASEPPRDGMVPEVQHTWDHARVYLPGRLFATTPRQVPPAQRMPVVVYLHGCTGLTLHDRQWAQTLAAQGVIVLQPDSFARSGRHANCDPATRRVGLYPAAARMRDEELHFALERLQRTAWADPARLFVMGHSEGGRAAMTNVLAGVRGTIVSGWGCRSSNTRWNGIPHPIEHPLLILEHDNDPWYVGRGGQCKDYLEGRIATRHVTLGSGGHNSVQSDAARAAVAEFLAGLMR